MKYVIGLSAYRVLALTKLLLVARPRKDDSILNIVKVVAKTLVQYFTWTPTGHEKVDIAMCSYYATITGELHKIMFDGTSILLFYFNSHMAERHAAAHTPLLHAFSQFGGISAFFKSLDSVVTFYCEKIDKQTESLQPMDLSGDAEASRAAPVSNTPAGPTESDLAIMDSCLCGYDNRIMYNVVNIIRFAKFMKLLSSAKFILNSPVHASMIAHSGTEAFDPVSFIKVIQEQVLDALLSLWSLPQLPKFPTNFIVSLIGVISNCLESKETIMKVQGLCLVNL